MFRSVAWLLVLLMAFSVSGLARASGGGTRTPLDLPSGGRGAEDTEEDAPDVINFYGSSFEGDAFFWLLDRSLSMQGVPITVLKLEVTDAIRQLSSRAEFALISFDQTYTVFPSQAKPLRATRTNKTAGEIWVNGIQLGIWTCMEEPAGRIIEIANLSRKRKKTILMVGDGIPLCGGFTNNTSAQVLMKIDATNSKRIPINTIFISHDDDESLGATFFRQIATRNNGKFIVVDL